jgi:hypothetical protein
MKVDSSVAQQTSSTAGIIQTALANSMTYIAFKELSTRLNAEGKTSGNDQSEAMLNYSKMNEHRMRRLDKTIVISSDLEAAVKAIQKPQTWLVITEVWCGDGAQNIPVVNKMAQFNPMINLRFVLRDENPELMDCFLTNGAKSIPVVLALNDQMDVLWKWGPRPVFAQEMRAKYLMASEPKISYEAFSETLHKWYTDNKTEMTQKEFLQLIVTNNESAQ